MMTLRDALLELVLKYSPDQPRDDYGRWADMHSHVSLRGVERLGPVTGPDGKVLGGKSEPLDDYKPGAEGGFVTNRESAARARRASHRVVTEGDLSSSERADFDDLADYQQEGYLYLRSNGWTHADALGAKASYTDLAKEATVAQMFKCVSCATPMEHWRDGSTCPSCTTIAKAAAKPGTTTAAKPGAKKPAGSVQDEFPRCPTCGTPTKTGEKCDDCKKSTEREHKTGDLTLEQMEAQMREAEVEAEEESERRDIRRRARAAMARMLGLDDLAKAAVNAKGNPPLVLKASSEKRFSFAPMYMPGRLDAHREFVKSGDELQEAAWEYVRKTSGDRTVYLQHIDKPAGEWVEITSWPYPVEAVMNVPSDDGTTSVRKATLPAGTVYMGVIWEPWAWNLVQKGRLLGFSMGGWAKRVQAELADESVTKSHGAGSNGEPWTQAGVVNSNHRGAVRERLGVR